ncbi:MAG TPA: type IV-A pilus assembly ATPase PilB, partial [Thioploca sp.]|nr:type IV-A pilus assembly ATPase PilB [Thioploca sp.]
MTGLARKLVDNDLISEFDADNTVKEALNKKIPFITHLVNQGLASSQDIANIISKEFRIPLLDINGVELD